MINRQETVLLTTFSIVLFSVVLTLSFLILQQFPNSGDEYAYIYQAKTFIQNRTWNNPHELNHFFKFWNILVKDEKMFSIFPPGWPLLIAAFMSISVPAWIINPIIGCISIICLYFLSRSLSNSYVAKITIFVTALSSFYLFNAASFFSHNFCSLLIILFTLSSFKYFKEDKLIYAFLAGTFLGWAFITRYFTAILCMMPILIYYIYYVRKKNLKGLLFSLIGASPFIVFLLLYNYSISGNAFILPRNWVGGYDEFELMFSGIGLRNLISQIFLFHIYTPIFFFIIYCYYVAIDFYKLKNKLLQGDDLKVFFVSLNLLLLIIAHYFFNHTGENQYGPRFYYEGFPFLVLYICRSLFYGQNGKKDKQRKTLAIIFGAGILIHLPIAALLADKNHQIIYERTDLYRIAQQKNLKNSIIFLQTGTGHIYEMHRYDLTRNNFRYSNSVLYAASLGAEKDQQLKKLYPNRSYYIYYYNDGGHLVKYQ